MPVISTPSAGACRRAVRSLVRRGSARWRRPSAVTAGASNRRPALPGRASRPALGDAGTDLQSAAASGEELLLPPAGARLANAVTARRLGLDSSDRTDRTIFSF